MASGIINIFLIVAMTHNEEPIILGSPTDEFDLTVFDSIFLEDEPCLNIDKIPKRVGMYEVEGNMHWNDGCNVGFERVDGDISFEIINVKPLYRV